MLAIAEKGELNLTYLSRSRARCWSDIKDLVLLVVGTLVRRNLVGRISQDLRADVACPYQGSPGQKHLVAVQDSLTGDQMLRKESITAQTLIDQGLRPQTPREYVRSEVRKRLHLAREKGMGEEAVLQSLFPHTVVDFETLESLITALLSGNHLLFFGPPGSGKTNLAKDIWSFFQHDVWAVKGCPVQENPFSLTDPNFSRIIPPCPICRMTYGGLSAGEVGEFKAGSVDPSTIPVHQVHLREGLGLARIQGSPEIFPDNLTGTINIHKLEELGDPTSPLVLEPGKMLQANRGLLMVDEIGKLPIGTQNVLLQALQENIVTPGKSKETFPASFIAVATSNLEDLDNINEPLNDRLVDVYIGFSNRHYNNRLIVDMAMRKMQKEVFIPDIYIETGVYLTETWRSISGEAYEFSEISSNRSMIDILARTEAYATLGEKRSVDLDHFRKGTNDAMFGRIRVRGGDSYLQNTDIIRSFLERHLDEELARSAKLYWCGFYEGALNKDKPEALRVIDECRSVLGQNLDLEASVKDGSPHKKFRKFSEWVGSRERNMGTLGLGEATAKVISLLEELHTFSGGDEC